MFPIKDLNFLSCTPFFHQVLQRTRSVQHTITIFSVSYLETAMMRLFGFLNCQKWFLAFLFAEYRLEWIGFFFSLIWGCGNLEFLQHAKEQWRRYEFFFYNMPKNDGADMIAGCRPGADMIGASAPMWLAACVWTLQYPEFRQFPSFCHNSTNMIRTSQCELFNIRSFDNSLPPLCHKSTNVIRTSQCELSNNANFDILYIHVLFRISTSVQHLLGLIRVLKDFN